MLLFYLSDAKAQKYPYTFQADVGALIGKGVIPGFSAQVFNGIKIESQKLEVGIVSGVDVYSMFSLIPLSAGIKWIPLQSKPISPFISFNAGYGLDWLQKDKEQTSYKGGGVFNPSVGIRIKTTGKAKVNLSAGYKQQQATISTSYLDNNGNPTTIITEKYKLGRLSACLGLSL